MTNMKQLVSGFFLVLAFLIVLGCDTAHEATVSSGLSSVSFTVAWPDENDDVDLANGKLAITAAEKMSDTCESRGVSQVTVQVNSSSGLVLKSATFACSAKSGILSGIKPQAGCTIVVYGKNATGDSLYKGQKTDVTLIAGTNNAGIIQVGKILPRITFNALPDTGQTESYTDTFGEDSDYTINPPSYTKLDDTGTALGDNAASWTMVLDNVTGLIWEVKQSSDGYSDYDKSLFSNT